MESPSSTPLDLSLNGAMSPLIPIFKTSTNSSNTGADGQQVRSSSPDPISNRQNLACSLGGATAFPTTNSGAAGTSFAGHQNECRSIATSSPGRHSSEYICYYVMNMALQQNLGADDEHILRFVANHMKDDLHGLLRTANILPTTQVAHCWIDPIAKMLLKYAHYIRNRLAQDRANERDEIMREHGLVMRRPLRTRRIVPYPGRPGVDPRNQMNQPIMVQPANEQNHLGSDAADDAAAAIRQRVNIDELD